MRIWYHLSTLPPSIPQAEAISQEIAVLQEQFNGDVIWVNPNRQFPLYVPRLLFGFHKLKEIRRREENWQAHHFYNPDPFPFPYLRYLRRPVLYSITCGVGHKRPNLDFFSSLAAVVVSDQRSLDRLRDWGLKNVVLVRTAIETARFSYSPLPLQSEIKLLVGSAPWTKAQFRTKGVEALLAAARQLPRLQLVFLWRGVLTEEMKWRVQQLQLERQVTIINRLVDVNKLLADVHASVTLAESPGIVKSYPHSLLESLAAGKPVLISQAIPMADYVEATNCGKIVETVTPAAVLAAVEALAGEYNSLQQAARLVGQRDFSRPAMIASYETLYQDIVESD